MRIHLLPLLPRSGAFPPSEIRRPITKARATSFVFRLCLTPLCSPAAFSQDQEVTETSSTAPVALVCIQVTKGVNVYAATAAGILSLIKGSPFKISGQTKCITGSHLLFVGTTNLYSYEIASNGAVGTRISSIDTAGYSSGPCGPTTGNQAVLDRSGKDFYGH
jgi:hypothetical protein